MKNTAELLPSALNESPEATPLFDPEELKEVPVKDGIDGRSKEYFKALDADKEPTSRDWNRYLQFQVARKRAEKDGSKLELDAQGRGAVEQYSKQLADKSTWADEDGNIDYLSVAQAGMALRYLGAEVKFSKEASADLQSALFTNGKFLDSDRALRYGIALKNLRSFDASGNLVEDTLFGGRERQHIQEYNILDFRSADEPVGKAVIRLAQMEKLGISADKVGLSAKELYVNTFSRKLKNAASAAFDPNYDFYETKERRRVLKALVVSKSVFDEPVVIDQDQAAEVRSLIKKDKESGLWKEFLNDAIYAKQLEGSVALKPEATQQGNDSAESSIAEPTPPVTSAGEQTIDRKLDETFVGRVGNESQESVLATSEEIAEELALNMGGSSVASEKHPDTNEDKMLYGRYKRGVAVAAVFDGMGGLAGGDAASGKAFDAVDKFLEEMTKDGGSKITTQGAEELARLSLERAQRVLAFENGDKRGDSRMGTTGCVALLIGGDNGGQTAVIGNVGDSRAWVLRASGQLEHVTLDDAAWPSSGRNPEDAKSIQERFSQINSMDELGDDLQLKVAFHRRNEITQYLGDSSDVDVSVYKVALETGDQLLITSDGVHDNLTAPEIQEILVRAQDAHGASVELVNKAQAYARTDGGRAKKDDMTAVVIRVPLQPEATSENVKDDPQFQLLFEEASLEYLKKKDPYFLARQNLTSVRGPNGRLLGRDGKESDYWPSQNIGPAGYDEVFNEAKKQFATKSSMPPDPAGLETVQPKQLDLGEAIVAKAREIALAKDPAVKEQLREEKQVLQEQFNRLKNDHLAVAGAEPVVKPSPEPVVGKKELTPTESKAEVTPDQRWERRQEVLDELGAIPAQLADEKILKSDKQRLWKKEAALKQERDAQFKNFAETGLIEGDIVILDDGWRAEILAGGRAQVMQSRNGSWIPTGRFTADKFLELQSEFVRYERSGKANPEPAPLPDSGATSTAESVAPPEPPPPAVEPPGDDGSGNEIAGPPRVIEPVVGADVDKPEREAIAKGFSREDYASLEDFRQGIKAMSPDDAGKVALQAVKEIKNLDPEATSREEQIVRDQTTVSKLERAATYLEALLKQHYPDDDALKMIEESEKLPGKIKNHLRTFGEVYKRQDRNTVVPKRRFMLLQRAQFLLERIFQSNKKGPMRQEARTSEVLPKPASMTTGEVEPSTPAGIVAPKLPEILEEDRRKNSLPDQPATQAEAGPELAGGTGSTGFSDAEVTKKQRRKKRGNSSKIV